MYLNLFLKKAGDDEMKQHVFLEVTKFKIQRCCKSCGKRMVVENANRFYCTDCRGY